MPRLTTPEGVQKVMMVPGNIDRLMFVEGFQFDAAINDTTLDTFVFTETTEIQGIEWVEVVNHFKGDIMELHAVAPDGSSLGRRGRIYVPPSGKMYGPVSEGTISLPATFGVQLRYISVATSGDAPEVYGAYRLRA